MAAAAEQMRRRQPHRAGTDDRHGPSGANLRFCRDDDSLFKAVFGQKQLVFPDGHRAVHLAADACALAERRTDAAGEFREAVDLEQAGERVRRVSLAQHVVPLRDQVVQRAAKGPSAERTAGLTERNAAVIAAAGLGLALLQSLVVHGQDLLSTKAISSASSRVIPRASRRAISCAMT